MNNAGYKSNRTQYALKLISKELREQRVLLEKLIDASLLNHASIEGLKNQIKRSQDLISGVRASVDEVAENSKQNNGQLKKHEQRLRQLEASR